MQFNITLTCLILHNFELLCIYHYITRHCIIFPSSDTSYSYSIHHFASSHPNKLNSTNFYLIISFKVKKLQLLTSGKGSTSLLSGTSTPVTPSTPISAERPSFRVKTPEVPASHHPTIVIPIRKVEDEKKTTTPSSVADDGTASPAATTNGVGKLSKKLFPVSLPCVFK